VAGLVRVEDDDDDDDDEGWNQNARCTPPWIKIVYLLAAQHLVGAKARHQAVEGWVHVVGD
jgi:hypothetical protein